MSDNYSTSTLILAGGKGSRLNGQDKGLITLKNKSLISYSIAVAPTNSRILASINRNIEQYSALTDECISDSDPYAGPMIAIWQAARHVTTPYLLVLPCDTPLLPHDIGERLLAPLIAGDHTASYASHNGRGHYCCMAATLQTLAGITKAPRSMRNLLDQLNAHAVEFTCEDHLFLNVNTEQDLTLAAQYL